MSKPNSYRKFLPEQARIDELKQSSPRFQRIYSEYQTMSDELWELENSDLDGVPDDFLNSIRIQTDYLEDEIEDWLLDEAGEA